MFMQNRWWIFMNEDESWWSKIMIYDEWWQIPSRIRIYCDWKYVLQRLLLYDFIWHRRHTTYFWSKHDRFDASFDNTNLSNVGGGSQYILSTAADIIAQINAIFMQNRWRIHDEWWVMIDRDKWWIMMINHIGSSHRKPSCSSIKYVRIRINRVRRCINNLQRWLDPRRANEFIYVIDRRRPKLYHLLRSKTSGWNSYLFLNPATQVISSRTQVHQIFLSALSWYNSRRENGIRSLPIISDESIIIYWVPNVTTNW